MFGIVRLIIGLAFFACAIVIILRSRSERKRRMCITSLVVTVVLITILSFLPFENLFHAFSSAEDAYNYVDFGNGKVALVIEGDESDFVVGEKNDAYSYLIIPKTSEGWKVGLGVQTVRVIQKTIDEISICLYRFEKSDDYFVTVFNNRGGVIEISDSCNSRFEFTQ